MQPKTAKAVNAAKPMEMKLMQPKTAKAVNAAKSMEMKLMQPKTAKAVNASKTMLVPEAVGAMVELTLSTFNLEISPKTHKTVKDPSVLRSTLEERRERACRSGL